MQLKTTIISLLCLDLIIESLLILLEYKQYRRYMKHPLQFEYFSIRYSILKLSSQYLSIALSLGSLIYIISNFHRYVNRFSSDLKFTIFNYTIYFIFGYAFPRIYDQYIVESKVKYNVASINYLLSHLAFIYVLIGAALSLIVTIINKIYREDSNQLQDIDYEKKDSNSNVINPSPKSPWFTIFILLSLIALIVSFLNGYDLHSINAKYHKSSEQFFKDITTYVINDHVRTKHARIFLRGLFNPKIIYSDTLINVMHKGDIKKLAIVEYEMNRHQIPFMKLFLNIFKVFLFSLLIRNIHHAGLTSLCESDSLPAGRLLIATFALYVPLMFFMAPIENILYKQKIYASDCSAMMKSGNISQTLLDYYSWNGLNIKQKPLYALAYMNFPPIMQRLANLHSCRKY